MRNQLDNSKKEIKESVHELIKADSKKEIKESVHELIKAATRLSLALESDSEDSSDNSIESNQQRVKREVTKPPPVQSSQHSKRSRVPTQRPRNVSSHLLKNVSSCQQNSVPKRLGPYKLGERLIITNNYLKAGGTEGIVLASKVKYTVIQDNEGSLHTRAHSNYNRVVT